MHVHEADDGHCNHLGANSGRLQVEPKNQSIMLRACVSVHMYATEPDAQGSVTPYCIISLGIRLRMSLRTMHFVSVDYSVQAQLVAVGSQLVGTVAVLGVVNNGAAESRYHNTILDSWWENG